MPKKKQEEKREHFTILVGGNQYDSEVINVICYEKDLETIALSHYYWKRQELGRPIACVVKRGEGVNFNNFDFLFADCM